VSGRNIWDTSATASGIKREWYVCIKKYWFATNRSWLSINASLSSAYLPPEPWIIHDSSSCNGNHPWLDNRFGVVGCILACYARGRGLDCHTLTFQYLLLFPTLIPLSEVGTVFHHVVIKTRQLFLPAACLTSTLLETGVGANDCKCNRDQRPNVSKHGGAWNNKFWPPILWLTNENIA
jgi:hypothetical protein